MRIGDSAGIPPSFNTEWKESDRRLLKNILDSFSLNANILHDKTSGIENAVKNLKDDIHDLRHLSELTEGRLPQSVQDQINHWFSTYNIDGLGWDAQGILDLTTRDRALSKISHYKIQESVESLKDMLKGLI